jgi:hypothetical protein
MSWSNTLLYVINARSRFTNQTLPSTKEVCLGVVRVTPSYLTIKFQRKSLNDLGRDTMPNGKINHDRETG